MWPWTKGESGATGRLAHLIVLDRRIDERSAREREVPSGMVQLSSSPQALTTFLSLKSAHDHSQVEVQNRKHVILRPVGAADAHTRRALRDDGSEACAAGPSRW